MAEASSASHGPSPGLTLDSNGDLRSDRLDREAAALRDRTRAMRIASVSRTRAAELDDGEIGDARQLAVRVAALEDALAVAQAAIAHLKGLAEGAAAAAASLAAASQQALPLPPPPQQMTPGTPPSLRLNSPPAQQQLQSQPPPQPQQSHQQPALLQMQPAKQAPPREFDQTWQLPQPLQPPQLLPMQRAPTPLHSPCCVDTSPAFLTHLPVQSEKYFFIS